MLDIKEIYKLQSDYNVSDGTFKDAEVSYEEYITQCRTFITNNLPSEYHKGEYDMAKKQSVYENLISQFVDAHKVKVEGYVSKEGVIDATRLLEDVYNSVSGASILTDALEDPDVDEIQINDKNTIFVSKRGVLVPYVDKRGHVKKFVNDKEIEIVLNKLIDDGTGNVPLFTDGNPILNEKTAKEQYRINAVHHSVNTMDKPPHNFPITSVVIRKFKEVKLTVEDLIETEAITEQMGRLLMLLGRAELKLFCVGPTGSGKTTLLNIIAGTIPYDKRIILVQNPTEISFKERDEHGRNIRNVVHWEVTNAAQMDALITNTLRATPEIIIIGEAREHQEFYQIQRAMRTGHKVLGTYHAEDEADAIGRFATEISTVGGTSYMESLRLVADTVDIIISQFRFPDGRRRVMGISEIEGVDSEGKVKINQLFRFEMSGEMRKNKYGLIEVLGEFKQVGILSERTRKTFYKAGISKDEIAEFCVLPSELQEERSEVKGA